jgi:hypothetical protein
MTIDEAIKHCGKEVKRIERNHPYIDTTGYKQLVEWLKELKEYKDARVGCEYCKHKFREQHERPCSLWQRNFMDMFEREVKADADSD